MLTYDFSGQVAFVTGASAGMGAAAARAFAEGGAAVALADIDQDALERFASELSDQGHHVLPIPCDVSDEDAVAAAVRQTADTLGRLDAAFNNAGIMIPPADAAEEPAEASTG